MSARSCWGIFVSVTILVSIVLAPGPVEARGKVGIKARVVKAYRNMQQKRVVKGDFKRLLKRSPLARKTFKQAKKDQGLGTARVMQGVTITATAGMLLTSAAHLANGGSPGELLPLAGPTLASGFGAKVSTNMVRNAKRGARAHTVLKVIKAGEGHLVSGSLKRDARGYLAGVAKQRKAELKSKHRDVNEARSELNSARTDLGKVKSQLKLVSGGL